ncbi:MAG: 5'-nucleotidase C-terminal domain-containing protein [Clostridium beijerinckii]|nr:5'-nucleotidase C-terminal domain-containing protein [Clostridium beijerinckii]MCI1580630.1 5'-nucleotidase C-terminal domain-containing protein [Clostridium beijerinckii]MCI1584025.1 5'-nucleotidase C-terminal domain-containing protein [Clostridium beijerinckii]MCI1623776.1 5'-nucleotidase C-terminal domain-containing protein [Clostridium beijerinckii]
MKKLLKFRKVISIFTSLFFIITLFSSFSIRVYATENEKMFDVIEITDFHGTLNDSSGNQVAGVLADRIEKVKESNKDRTLILGGGDLYQGSATSNIMKGVPVQETMSKIGMEITTLGNHEFDWGLDTTTNTTMKGAAYSIVCSNLYDKKTGKRVFDPYKIITKDGIKIAVIGGITRETETSVSPKFVSDYKFTDLASEINPIALQIKKDKLADVVIVLVHEGDKGDNATGPVFDLANNLQNVDAVFGGHSHTKTAAIAKNTNIPVYIGGSNGKGYIDAKFKLTSDNKIVFDQPNLETSYVALDNDKGYKTGTPQTDSDVDKIVDNANKQIEPMTSEVIGYNTEKDLTRKLDASPYGSSVLGNWASDVTRNSIKADVGFQNNGGLRIDIPQGNITVGTMWQFMPFDNTIYKLSMTKSQLKEVLEQAVADNSKGLQVSGIKFGYDSNLPSGQRVKSITKEDGTPISDNESLSVAVPDFVAQGGDSFTAFTKYGGLDVKNDTHVLVRDAFIDWCKENKDKNDKNTIPNTDIPRMVNMSSSITLLATTDVHGTVLNYDYGTGKAPAKAQGLAKVSSYVKSVRENNNNVMLIDNGDTIQGTPLSYYYDILDTTLEHPMAKVMGAMKYDSWTLGNHEFNYGLDVLNRVIKDYKSEGIAVLGANIYKKDSTNFVDPYIMKSFYVNGKEVKVAVIGLENKCIPSWEDKKHYDGLVFNDLVDESKKWVKEVKAKGADVVIISAHSGQESDADVIPENEINAIATQVNGIDAIIAGHTHLKVNDLTKKNPEGKVVPIVESTKGATGLAQADMNFDGNAKLIGISTKNIVIDNSIVDDQEIVDLIKPYEDTTLKYVDTKIGTSTGEFTGSGQLTEPTAIMELINKVQKESAGTQLSIAAPLSSGAYIPQGDVTIKDMMAVYVFENFLYGVKMTGKQLKDWMEYSVRYYAQTTGDNAAVIKDPILNIPDYNLDQLYGATYDIDLTQPACTIDQETGRVISGNRIKNLKVNGVEVKDSDEFTVAINNYRFNGGGGFMKAAGLSNTDPSIIVYDSGKALGDDGQVRSLMTSYIKKHGEISPDCSNNWEILNVDKQKKAA